MCVEQDRLRSHLSRQQQRTSKAAMEPFVRSRGCRGLLPCAEIRKKSEAPWKREHAEDGGRGGMSLDQGTD